MQIVYLDRVRYIAVKNVNYVYLILFNSIIIYLFGEKYLMRIQSNLVHTNLMRIQKKIRKAYFFDILSIINISISDIKLKIELI